MFAIGLNYKKHAAEMGSPLPPLPLVFSKFQSSLNSPAGDVKVVGETVDYESELVIIVGKGGRDIVEANAWQHIAGLCVGQDVSDRGLQYMGSPAQFNMGKSRDWGIIGTGVRPADRAMLEGALDRWRALAEPYRTAAREAIARVAARAELSNDVREVVTRALAD